MLAPKYRKAIIEEALLDLLEYYQEVIRVETEEGGTSAEELKVLEEFKQKSRDIEQVLEGA